MNGMKMRKGQRSKRESGAARHARRAVPRVGWRLAALGCIVATAASCAEAPAVVPPDPDTDPALTPALDLMGPDERYHGVEGGLVDNGAPDVTPTDGRIVIIAISMSNGRQEFARFIELYEGDPAVDPAIGLVNCARGGHALERWLADAELWEDCRRRVAAAGYSLGQVKVVWAKDANQFTAHGRTLPDPAADYHDMVENISAISQRIGAEFPSVQAVFHSSRIYGGYVAEARQAARGEPISYEGGFAVNEAIRRWQQGELPGAPWIGWGPYLWASGPVPNGSGISWERADFEGIEGDDPHPSQAGETKVAQALHAFFLRFAWYRR